MAKNSSAQDRVAVVGLGKIGLPLAAVYASRGCNVIGCDIDPGVVEEVNAGRCSLEEPGLRHLVHEGHSTGRLCATSDTGEAARRCNVIVLIVPMVIDNAHSPDFSHLMSATRSIALGLRRDALVLVETTMPVGSTRDRLLPVLEGSGLKAGRDFQLAYSPERVSSGTILRDLATYPKIVGGIDHRSTATAAEFYKRGLGCNVLTVGGSDSAEFTKLVETTYRDVNIALANEYARYAASRGLDVMEAIMAANTQPFSHVHTPGIGVGGHCIPVYPYFLMHGSQEWTLPPTARAINDGMPEWSARVLDRELDGLAGRRVLVLGLAYRTNVTERAFTAALPLIEALKERGAEVLMNDPLFVDDEIAACGAEPVRLESRPAVDAAVIQTWHKSYEVLDFSAFPGCRIVLDGRNRLSPGVRDGVRYIGVGRGLHLNK